MELENRPWGWFLTLDQGEGYKVKKIFVNPRSRFSLQYHKHRTEDWVVVQGIGLLTQGNSEKVIRPGEYCFIPKGQIHRLSAGDDGVMFIEVQQGICEEEDIVRLSDDYGRS